MDDCIIATQNAIDKVAKIIDYCMEHLLMEILINLVIFLNTIAIAIRQPDTSGDLKNVIIQADFYARWIFTAEIVLRILGKGFILQKQAFLRTGWGIFDTAIVVSRWIDMVYPFGNLLFLRMLRLYKMIFQKEDDPFAKRIDVFKISQQEWFITSKVLVETVAKSSTQVIQVVVLLLFTMLLAGVFGINVIGSVLTNRCAYEDLNGGSTSAYTDTPNKNYTLSVPTMACHGGNTCPNFQSVRTSSTTYFPGHLGTQTCVNLGELPSTGHFCDIGGAAVLVFQAYYTDSWSVGMFWSIDALHPAIVALFIFLVIFGAFYLMSLTVATTALQYGQLALIYQNKIDLIRKEEQRLKDEAEGKHGFCPKKIFRTDMVWFFALLAACVADPSTVWETDVVDFAWGSAADRAAALANGSYVPEMNVVTGIKYWDGLLYLTVPRWKHGVPSTMNVYNMQTSTDNLLVPWPSWEMNQIGNCAALQYTQSMEIDSLGRMWIIDVGRLNILDLSAQVPYDIYKCPPKLVIIDIATKTVLKTFVFGPDTAPYKTSFLNDIVLDQKNGYAFISDTGLGGIVVYNINTNTARRYEGFQTAVEVGATLFTINGYNYTISSPCDTIALSPDASTLYFGALSGYTMYKVPTAVLVDFSNTALELNASISVGFTRRGPTGLPTQCDGMVTSTAGDFYYGSHSTYTDASLVSMGAGGNVTLLNASETRLDWVDTFGWGPPGILYFTTNRLAQFLLGYPPLQTGKGANFRALAIALPGHASYLSSPEQQPPIAIAFPSVNPDGGAEGVSGVFRTATIVLAVTTGVLFLTLVAGGLVAMRSRRGVDLEMR